MQTVHALVQEFSLDPERGLSAAQLEASRRKYGANVLTPLPREPIWRKFLEKFDEPIIRILLAAALLSMVVDLFRAHAVLASASAIRTGAVRKSANRRKCNHEGSKARRLFKVFFASSRLRGCI